MKTLSLSCIDGKNTEHRLGPSTAQASICQEPGAQSLQMRRQFYSGVAYGLPIWELQLCPGIGGCLGLGTQQNASLSGPPQKEVPPE